MIEGQLTNKYREPTGLIDGPSTVLTCFQCDKALVELKVFREVPGSIPVQSECPFCGAASLPYSTKVGLKGFRVTGAEGVTITNMTDQNDVFFISTAKETL